jgi:hypothetical protein
MSLLRMALESNSAEKTLEDLLEREWRDGEYVAFDLDGTMTMNDGWKGPDYIGEPIPEVIQMIVVLRTHDIPVKVFTARAATTNQDEFHRSTMAINAFCEKHIGEQLPITAEKDMYCIRIFDDRARQVVENEGTVVEE